MSYLARSGTPRFRGVAGILALAGVVSWALAYSGLFPPHPQLPEIFSYIAIVLDIAALVIAIIALRRHETPAWIAIAAIVLSAASLLYFGVGAIVAFSA